MASTPAAVLGVGPKGPLGWVRRHPLGAFYAVTFLVSWGYWVPDAISGGHHSHTPGLLGPMVAAVVVTGAVEGTVGLRELWSRMIRWRVPLRWYLAAAAPLVFAVGVAAFVSLGAGLCPSAVPPAPRPAPGQPAGVGSLDALARPDLLPRHRLPWLQPDAAARVRLGDLRRAVVLTWLYEGAGCSILLVALWYAFLNLGSATNAGEGAVQVSVTMLVIIWSLLIARSWRRAAAIGRFRSAAGAGSRNQAGPRARF